MDHLNRTLEKHCLDDDRRHLENLAALADIRLSMENLNRALSPLLVSVREMKPIVDHYQTSRLKVAGALTLVSATLTLVGAVFISLLNDAIRWFGSLLKW